MNTVFLRPASVLVHLAALLVMAPAWAASPGGTSPSRASIDATYQQDRAACLRGDAQHERSSCLREAGAVRAEALRGRAAGHDTPEAWAQNALQRCRSQTGDNVAICERMVRGEGGVSGSVAGGGVIRELVTPLPAPALVATPPEAPPAPAR
ncbi:MAG: hypothetical protein KGZ70_05795 [Hydrogenophaga sp.]|uniref:hypothetical protein n=1 Tax=Hydrogenophaga sp. TaxID=1904254 RepID=UPI001BB9EA04|nr:hypothetical protein [Hydrogenophaga sp.]MBS3911334.1 hypothetical protein [Hydrogenophaga sp.]MDO9149581.1 hypothetical protein [Hydrogenophaga sp.]MDO9603878.1 hypothetical protein [Hydrogenophaga sp.]